MTQPACFTADELAAFLGVNRKTVYEYAARGVIPHRRLGRRIVFSRDQVVTWLGACGASSD
jgi:excisionase family DNA binding protein